jgi:hypothetical protein
MGYRAGWAIALPTVDFPRLAVALELWLSRVD